MDWLRRNWVDVLMAGLILAVVGGFLTLLLRGGVFKPNAEANPSVATNSTSVTTVPAPTTPKPTPTPTSSQPTPPSLSKPAVTTTKPRTTTPLGVPEIPEAPVGVVSIKPTTSTASTAGSDAPNSSTSNLSRPTAAINRPTVQPNTSSKTVTPSSPPLKTTGTYTRADFLRNYRVAAGSYTNLERAKKAVVQIRSRGLPAQTFPSGNTHVVVVGPYAREASARSAFNKVKQIFPDAILYRPDGTKEASARVNPTPKPAAVPQGGGGQPATLDVAYLQVGAFKDIKGATALLAKLKNAGFAPLTKSISGLLRVLVGPLQTNQIQTIRSELKNQGFEAFQVNL
ncbi:MAG: hypothetical protein RLZZ156_2392 [Deinococcota bacterium]|jgi:cell division septation protein DedD